MKIVSIHIENDVVNKSPTLVYTDETGEEWVMMGKGLINYLEKKKDCWYFKTKK